MADNKDKKVLNVPHLRFPEFSGEWEKYMIGELCEEFKSGKNIKAENIKEEGAYPVFGGNGLRGYTDRFNHDGEYVLIGRQGALCGNVRFVTGKTYITEHAIAAKATTDNYTRYLECLFIRLNLGQFSDQSAQPGLAVNKLLKIEAFVPSKAEQIKIASLLMHLDERIATQNKVIEDLKLLKSAMTESLYSNVKGTTYTYRQLFDVINERNKDNVYNNVLSASQELGMIDRSDINIDIKFEQASIVNYKIVRKGDYVVHLRSFQGGFAFSEKTGICSSAYTILRPNDNLIFGYLSNYFTSKKFVKSLKLVTYGIRDGRSINVDEWMDMKVVIPGKKEQSHILNTINSVEFKLRNEHEICSRLIKQKSYLLRQMFI